MAYGFLIDPDARQYGAWKMGYIVDGSQPIQAWMMLPPYVLGFSGREASDEPNNDPDSRTGSSSPALPDNPPTPHPRR